ncbi:MAG: hypothetical protein AMXMBFR25_14660 [Lysobacterales bacterium]
MSAVDAVPWDYAALAPHYELRADYCADTVCDLLDACGVARLAPAVDIGAGTGRLTRLLLARGHRVEAVEPCAPMRAIGIGLTRGAVRWHAADGAATGLPAGSAALVAFGSSFNVLAPAAAIAETLRLLGGRGHALLLWNHRDFDDPLQARVEALLRARAPTYRGGRRREDPLPDWRASGALRGVRRAQGRLRVRQPLARFVEGFRAHGTLLRHLVGPLDELLAALHTALAPDCADGHIEVPFDTRAWCLELAT